MILFNQLPPQDEPTPFKYSNELTHRETQVLQLVAAGHQSQEVADLLFLSKRTIDFHLGKVFSKLSVSNRTQAVFVASRLGILPDPRMTDDLLPTVE